MTSLAGKIGTIANLGFIAEQTRQLVKTFNPTQKEEDTLETLSQSVLLKKIILLEKKIQNAPINSKKAVLGIGIATSITSMIVSMATHPFCVGVLVGLVIGLVGLAIGAGVAYFIQNNAKKDAKKLQEAMESYMTKNNLSADGLEIVESGKATLKVAQHFLNEDIISLATCGYLQWGKEVKISNTPVNAEKEDTFFDAEEDIFFDAETEPKKAE